MAIFKRLQEFPFVSPLYLLTQFFFPTLLYCPCLPQLYHPQLFPLDLLILPLAFPTLAYNTIQKDDWPAKIKIEILQAQFWLTSPIPPPPFRWPYVDSQIFSDSIKSVSGKQYLIRNHALCRFRGSHRVENHQNQTQWQQKITLLTFWFLKMKTCEVVM